MKQVTSKDRETDCHASRHTEAYRHKHADGHIKAPGLNCLLFSSLRQRTRSYMAVGRWRKQRSCPRITMATTPYCFRLNGASTEGGLWRRSIERAYPSLDLYLGPYFEVNVRVCRLGRYDTRIDQKPIFTHASTHTQLWGAEAHW